MSDSPVEHFEENLDMLIGAINELQEMRVVLLQPSEYLEKRLAHLVSIYEQQTGESAVLWSDE